MRINPFIVAVFLAALASMPARASEQEQPGSIRLPTRAVVALRQYLGARPYDEVADLVNAIATCTAAQVPQNGVIRDMGQCPEVSAALRAENDRLAEGRRQGAEEAERKARVGETAPDVKPSE